MKDQIKLPASKAGKLLKILVMVTLAVVAVHVTLKYFSVEIYNEKHGFMFELSNRFDLNDENSVPQWTSQTLFLLTGLSAFLAAYMSRQKAVRKLWALVGVVTVLLSLDDASTLHEFVLQTIHNTFFIDTAPTLLRNSWLIIAPVVLIGVLWLVIKMASLFPRRTTILLAFGLVTFFTGALAIDSLVNTVPERSFMGQGLLSAIEGGLQLLGVSILLYSIADYIERQHSAAVKSALRSLKQPKS